MPKEWHYPTIIRYSNILNIISLIFYFSLEIIIDYHLFPLAEDLRKSDFIDNSWGTKNLLNNSNKYYDNDELGFGLYKTATNLFENVFFTYTISKSMSLKKISVSLILAIIIIVIAYYGFEQVPIAIPFMQVVFSTVILGDLFKHLVYVNRMKQVIEKWQSLFSNSDFKINPDNHRADVYKTWIFYESTLARTQLSLSNKIFELFNDKLTQEWEIIKIRYNIN